MKLMKLIEGLTLFWLSILNRVIEYGAKLAQLLQLLIENNYSHEKGNVNHKYSRK